MKKAIPNFFYFW